ncbi:hypothetical protein E1B28_001889 [Marasmius oreades]|uniref:BZIP domain-containing protein n=1 Tax=Marasmius oreades TaxID=181124 RepID=A0A9P8AFX2_9AGAR|nr:uncharacterized protein E1B28_001889 [Marasmius oreades]KAG7100109.1 hypothetical protein E1B28_001889 [Marasmius oreades]
MNPSPAYSYISLDSFDSGSSPTGSDIMDHNTHGFYQMGSSSLDNNAERPSSCTLDSSFTGAHHPSLPSPSRTSRTSPTGAIRPRHSPERLIGLDAPVQPRNYLSPSSTSRKEIPTYFLKRRPQPQRSEEEEDDELIEELPSNATDQEKIEFRRQRNTIAARRSRRRKMAYQQELEESVERLKMERQKWKTRAETLRQLLLSQGIPCPDWSE